MLADLNLKALTVLTLRAPQEAARQIMALALKRDVLWMALVLIALINAIQFALTFQLGDVTPPAALAPEEQALWGFFSAMAQRPLVLTLMLAVSLIISVFALHWVGRMLGGQGALGDVLAVVTWWQYVGFAVGLFVFALSLVSLPLAGMVNLISNIWLLYALSGLLAGVHAFRSPLGGLGTIVLSVLLLALGLALAFLLLGVGGGLGGANV